MLNKTPVLVVQDEMIVTCLEILHDKMHLLTRALALNGRAGKSTRGYDPLVGALTQLSIVARRMTTDFDPTAWRKAVEVADDRWWEWFDNYRPKGLTIAPADMNYSPHRDELEVIRERLRKLAYSLPMPEMEIQ